MLVPYLSEDATLGAPDAGDGGLGGSLSWSELLARGEGAELRFEQVPFDHPLWVLYSSGTTGLPKAIVQGHGGILIEQLKKRLHLDLRPGRPHVLVHDDRLDDVELPRRLPAHRRGDRALRRQPRAPGPGRPVAAWPSARASPAWASARACWRAARRPASSRPATTT